MSETPLAQEQFDLTSMNQDELMDVLAMLRADNAREAQSLATQGVQIGQAGMVAMKLDMLIAAILTEDQRMQLEIQFERQVASGLADAGREVRKARLTQPAGAMPPEPMPGGLLRGR